MSLLGRKAVRTLDSVFKNRNVIPPTEVHIVKTTVFPVVTYYCKSWTVKKAEQQRTDASELWCWRRLLKVPWTARRSNQPILKEINPEYSLPGLMLKLKPPVFWSSDVNRRLTGKVLDAGKDGGQKEKRMRWLDGITNATNMN